jgi:hypothetical protein
MDLKELLGEELFNQVTAKAGEHKIAVVSDGNWFPKEKFDDVNSQVKDLKKQLADRDKQLEDLKSKAAGNEELQNQIQQLQDQNNQMKQDYEKKIQEQQFNFALKEALTGAKAKNPKAVEALLNKEAIKLDGDKLLGLEEQLKSLKESDPYLFDAEDNGGQQQKPTFTTGQHQSSGNSDAFIAALLGKQE